MCVRNVCEFNTRKVIPNVCYTMIVLCYYKMFSLAVYFDRVYIRCFIRYAGRCPLDLTYKTAQQVCVPMGAYETPGVHALCNLTGLMASAVLLSGKWLLNSKEQVNDDSQKSKQEHKYLLRAGCMDMHTACLVCNYQEWWG